ncbi:MAG: DUF4097 family beta strand repeat protein [Bacilli bacterium]|nr:DUF4097 family beta strand repeat protein [Bacilli bacterium]MBN2877071.1 DUF4097 family beta strand repeat protein [Bacilli bacterium]
MGKLFKIALGLFLIGVGVFAIFSVLTDNNVFATVNEEDFTYNEVTYDADAFSGFDFNFENRDFIIRVSENDEIKVTYYTTEKDTVEINFVGSTLELVNDVEWYNQFFIGFSFLVNNDFYDVYLYLPASEIYDLDLFTSNGTIDILGIDNLATVNFGTSNGRISVDSIAATSLDLDTSNGKIRVQDAVLTSDLQLHTTNGSITVENISCADLHGTTSNRAISASNLTCDSVYLGTSNGDIDLEIFGDKADYEVTMTTSVGDMVYDGIEVSQEHFNIGALYEVELHTSNGDIVVSFDTAASQ